jgi:hypothetical protein
MTAPANEEAAPAGAALQDATNENTITPVANEPCKPSLDLLAESVGYLEEALCDLRDDQFEQQCRQARRPRRSHDDALLTPEKFAALELVQRHLHRMQRDAGEINTLIAHGRLNVRPISLAQIGMVASDVNETLFSHRIAAERLGIA